MIDFLKKGLTLCLNLLLCIIKIVVGVTVTIFSGILILIVVAFEIMITILYSLRLDYFASIIEYNLDRCILYLLKFINKTIDFINKGGKRNDNQNDVKLNSFLENLVNGA